MAIKSRKDRAVNEYGVKHTKNPAADAVMMLEAKAPPSVIAERLNMPLGKVEEIKEAVNAVRDRAEIIKEVLASFWFTIADAAMQHITEEKLRKASAKELATIAAISTEKGQLLEGKPTSVIAQYELVVSKYIIKDESSKIIPSTAMEVTDAVRA